MLVARRNPNARAMLKSHVSNLRSFSAVLTVTDIAGLVKGAHEGKGLGNEFLANISVKHWGSSSALTTHAHPPANI